MTRYRDRLDLITGNPERDWCLTFCSKAGPWKYLRAEAVVAAARSILREGASRLDVKNAAPGKNSTACEPYNIELYEVR